MSDDDKVVSKILRTQLDGILEDTLKKTQIYWSRYGHRP